MNDAALNALIAYDKLQIIFSQMMEYWLEDVDPPASLVDIYYEQLKDVQVAASEAKLFEKINRETADFYDKINSQYALDTTRRL